MATPRRSAREMRIESIVALQNELNQLKGEPPVSDDYIRYYDDYKLYELGDVKSRLLAEIEETRLQQRVAVFFAGEGKELKEEIEARKEDVKESFKNIIEAVKTLAQQSFANTAWTVTRTVIDGYGAAIDIDMIQKDGKHIFGTEIRISYKRNLWRNEAEAEFSTNVGTCGKNDLLDDSFGSRTFFYIQLGELLKNKELLNSIKDTLDKLTSKYREAEEERHLIEKVERDPFSYSFRSKTEDEED